MLGFQFAKKWRPMRVAILIFLSMKTRAV